jgi:hypothetical protein
VAKILAPWQHCLSGHRFFIGKGMQLYKTETAKSKIGAAKSKTRCREEQSQRQMLLLPGTARRNCDVHFEMRRRKYIHI